MPAKKQQTVRERANTGQTLARLWKRVIWQVVTLWLLALVAYSNSFQGGLVFDNIAIIAHDPRIRALTPETVQLIFTNEYWYGRTTSGLYRPLTTLSYLVNYSVFGGGVHPAGYHLVNLAIHDLNIALVYALGAVILGGSAPAFALAALWAVHPLLTESVTNIVGRADLLATFGVLAGLLCHVRGIAAGGWKRVAWLTALGGAQTIGMFSKESAAILPALMLLYDITWFRSQAWRHRLLPYAVLAVPLGAYFFLRSQVDTHMVVRFGENALIGSGFWTREITAVKVNGKFLWLFIWPARLSADYSFNAVPLFHSGANWEDVKALIAAIACAGLIVLAIRFRRHKSRFFFLVFFFIAIAPTSNVLFTVGTLMAERFMYLPSLALCGCLIIAIREIARATDLERPSWKWIALGVLTLAFGVRTYTRNFDWRDNFSLWSSAAAAYPENARAHFGLGAALVDRSEIPGAIAEFEKALRIRPGYAEVHAALGNALEQVPGRTPDAISEYNEALKLDPNMGEAHYNLGNALSRTPGRMQDAIAEWQTAVRLEPELAEAHYNLGIAYSQIPGRLQEAIAEYQAAVRIRPDYAEAHNDLGTIYSQLPGRTAEAVAEYEDALRIQPDSAEAHTNLGFVLARIPGRLPEAIAEYEVAIRLRPDFVAAHYHLGMALLQIPGRRSDAIDQLETALRISPNPEGRRMVDQLRAHP